MLLPFIQIDYRLKNIRTLDDNCQTPSITSQGFNKYCFINPGLFEDRHGNNEINIDKHIDTTFKCCPNRKANIYICSQCESVYHYKCAKKLDNIKPIGKVKANCCLRNESNDNNEKFDNKCWRENLKILKKSENELKLENQNLKDQISILNSQHINTISNEITFKNSEQELKTENLVNENELLKQLNKEMKDNNELLKEKNDWLTDKLNKKERSQWVKRNLGRVLKKRRRKPSNIIEPVEI
jgi:flagellar motility protein MotE (MotC chaperone)